MRSSRPRRIGALPLLLLCGSAVAAGADPSPPRPSPDAEAAAACIRLASSGARAAVEQASRMLERPGLDRIARLRAHICLGMAESHVGNAEAARSAALAAAALLDADESLPEAERSNGYGAVGDVLVTIGDIQQAVALRERAYDLSKRNDAPLWQIRTLIQRAQLASDFLDDLPGAEQLVRQALELAVAHGAEEGYIYYTYGMLLVRLKKYDEAMPVLDRALALLDKTAEQARPILASRIQTHRAEVLTAQGETAAARRLLDDSLEAQRSLPDKLGETVTLSKLARLQLATGDAPAAIASARKAEAIAELGGYRIERQQALDALADAQAAVGDAGAALATARRSFALEAKNLRTQNLQSIAGLQAREAQQAERHRNERADLLRDLATGALLVVVVLGTGFAAFQHHLNRRLRRLGDTDPLTGLLNRRAAGRRLDRLSPAADGRTDVVVLLDVDGFKSINDEHGHPQGDRVLKAIADRLRTVCADGDVLARWGGEEFLVVRRDVGVDAARAMAERLRTAIADAPFALSDGDLAISASIGFAAWPFFPDPDGNPWQDSLGLADRALYAAKDAGRNGWVGLWGTPAGVGTPTSTLRRSLDRAQVRGLVTMHSHRQATATGVEEAALSLPSPQR